MSHLAAVAFSAMLGLAEPGGQTDGSRVEVPFDSLTVPADSPGIEPPGFIFMRARWEGWTRYEERGEALDRWATIAHAVDRVCTHPPPAWKPRWGALGCTRGLVTILNHESFFWLSVHEGRLRGELGEVCLAQIHPAVSRKMGIDPETLVGADCAATERCLRVAVELLGLSRGLVEQRETVPEHWFGPSVARYGSGRNDVSTSAPWVVERVTTYARTGRRKALPFRALIALGN